jgi:hypothetical protein
MPLGERHISATLDRLTLDLARQVVRRDFPDRSVADSLSVAKMVHYCVVKACKVKP